MSGASDFYSRTRNAEVSTSGDEDTSTETETVEQEVSDDSGLTSTEEASEAGNELTKEDWAREAVDALDQAREKINARFLAIEKQTEDQRDQLMTTLEDAGLVMSELTKAQATFYRNLNVELPESMKLIAQGILDGQLENVAKEITTIVHKGIVDEFNPLLKKLDESLVNIRLAAADIDSKTGGIKPFLRTAGVSVLIASVMFIGLKVYFNFGADAEYGRKAKAVIQSLDPVSKTAMEKLISK